MRNFTKFILLLLLAAGGFFVHTKYRLFTLPSQQPVFQTERPVRRTIVHKKQFCGNIIPCKEVTIHTHIPGIVDKLFVKEGDLVQKGTAIARITIQPNTDKVEQAKSALRSAIIKRDKIRKTFLRDRVLFTKKMLAQEAYEATLAAWEDAKEQVAIAEKQLTITRCGYIKVPQGENSNIVKATTKGIALALPAKEGSMVNVSREGKNSAVVVIGDMENLLFSAKVHETDVVYLRKGMTFPITLNALKKEKLQVTLTHISPKANDEYKNQGEILFEIQGTIAKSKNKKIYLRAGYVGIAEIILDQAKNVLTVPENLIEREGEADVVKCLDNGKPINKKVRLGLSDGLHAEVKEGLTEMDQLIIEKTL
ncbi:efflux RND transporter periplasmic adaptor subunit [Candidatus Cardinium hertigii]|uniref:Macrolide export protein MacA n=1 Tax=Candidatus Cardinium hertigii TaxID=247481 RepID=A0A2Z3LDZ6_9BACT|nr:efflux RND transporter periplasmic adaptor subunit [Candidatus Cardinium hertigii]AWN82262.1 Macrolide export protein MacA [Candidatus Cardinium hertigii]